uniref:Uncharacterized protein n=1 Tax=Panagrolaimus sp. ES5 TaxID=591445 RepID=A0AC34FZB4_9BILA
MMQKLDAESHEIAPASIDFFNAKPTLVAFQQSSTVEYPPMTPLDNRPIHFRINSGQTYLDLSKLNLVTTFRVTRTFKDNKEKDEKYIFPITSADPVSFINGFGATFIKNLKVSFNDRQVYNSNDLYAYNAFLRRRLGLGVSRNPEKLELSGYFEDGLEQMSGPGFEARRALLENDSRFEAVCSLDVDIFQQNKLLLNQMIIDIEITPHNSAFTLLSTNTDPKMEYHYHLVDCKLYAKQHLLLPQLDYSIQEKLNGNAIAKYTYNRNIMKHFFISPGRYEYNAVLFNDYLPNRVFAALVDAKAFNGEIGMSPFEFAPFNVESIRLAINGAFTPANPYKLNWSSKRFGRAYKDLIDTVEGTHGISAQKFMTNSCIYGFDQQTSHSDRFIEFQQFGSTMISLNFNAPVQQNGLQLIVFAEFDSIIALDKARTLTTA